MRRRSNGGLQLHVKQHADAGGDGHRQRAPEAHPQRSGQDRRPAHARAHHPQQHEEYQRRSINGRRRPGDGNGDADDQRQDGAARKGNGRGDGGLQRAGAGDGFEAGPKIESQLSALRGQGSPLHNGMRARMEHGMNADFEGVRVHTDHESHQLNRSLQAIETVFHMGRS